MLVKRLLLLVLCASLGSPIQALTNPDLVKTSLIDSQNIHVNLKNVSIKEVFTQIEKQIDKKFIYRSDLEIFNQTISITISDTDLESILELLSSKVALDFKVLERGILVKKKEVEVKAFIQEQMIHGTVTVDDGMPLPGVTVSVLGTNKGVITDFEGKYAIMVDRQDAILAYSYLGYLTQEVSVNNKEVINIQLRPSASELDEVVVVGYGSQVKRDLTGAISTVSGEEIQNRKTTDLATALQGAVPGLTVTRSSSVPGGGAQIRLRGVTTLEGNSSPLILVDGVPVENLNAVNPHQIESISVLKDGASAAIYGSRAAAGVLLITTKRAKEGQFNVEYNIQHITNVPTEVPSTLGSVRYMEMLNEQTWNDSGNGSDEFPVYAQDFINNYGDNHIVNPDQYPDTNWKDLVLKDFSLGARHNLTLSGGSERLRTLATFGYEEQGALYDHRKWQRYTARINTDLEINEKIGSYFDFSFRAANQNAPIEDPTSESIYAAPIYPALWEDGRIAEGKPGSANPYATLHHGGFSEVNNYEIFGKLGFYYKPIEEIKVSLNFSPSFEFAKAKSFKKPIPYWDYDDPQMTEAPKYIAWHAPLNSDLSERRNFDQTYTTQALINYDTSFGKHRLSGVLGYEHFYKEQELLGVIGKEYEVYEYPFLGEAPVGKIFDNGSSISEISYRSFFGRLEYNFDRRYLVQFNVRRDGSSRFSPEYRWGTFPSISGGWVVSNEGFFDALNTPISFLKFQASYGKLGNDRIGNYLYLPVLEFYNVVRPNGSAVDLIRTAAQRFLAVENISWETTTTYNFGVDISFFEDRLSLNANYYKKETQDMLLDLSIPMLSGYEDPTSNVGDMATEGGELAITWRDNIGEFNYGASFNIFDSKSIIGDIKGKRIIGSTTISEEGSQFRSWYGYKSDGLYQTQEEVDNSAVSSSAVKPGDIKYVDVSGPDGIPDGIINEHDQTYLGGTTSPRFEYGGSLNFEYKGFDLGLSFQGVGKQKAYLSQNVVRPFRESWLSPPTIFDGNYWSVYNTPEENEQVQYPRLSNNAGNNNYRFSDYWLIDGSYFRLKNVTLGYSLPQNITNKFGVSNLRISLSGNDLFTIDNFPDGHDPEYGGGYLMTKSFILGVNIKI